MDNAVEQLSSLPGIGKRSALRLALNLLQRNEQEIHAFANSIIDLKFFSVNVHYILVYYWVLRQPQTLGYGFIFLSGIISDVIFGLPFGTSPLSLLTIAGVAAHTTTDRVTLTPPEGNPITINFDNIP